jgi:hypothetical protein
MAGVNGCSNPQIAELARRLRAWALDQAPYTAVRAEQTGPGMLQVFRAI